MKELSVPMVGLSAQVVCADGRELTGRLFVPANASRHSGPMRAHEWLNDPSPFFPFELEEGNVLLNKHEIVAVTLDAAADEGDVTPGVDVPLRAVKLECRDRAFAGIFAIEMPANHSRTSDYLNRDELFLTLRDGPLHHLVQKRRITRVTELPEPEREEVK